jgi:hypothetical protein
VNILLDDSPLNDPDYEPRHPPVDGQIPDVVARFGLRTQIRWFARFGEQLGKRNDWDDYYCQSEHHRGLCCGSCYGEYEDGYQGGGVIADGWCCCRDGRASWKGGTG